MDRKLELRDDFLPPQSADHQDGVLDFALGAFSGLFSLFFRFLGAAFRMLRPVTPQLIPLFICVLALPVLAFLSLSAGFFVWKTSAVSWEAPVWLQYGDGVPPYADVSLTNLASSQPYDVSLHLTVPNVASNYALGNFMVSLTLTTASNVTITSVRRPSIILPSSKLLSIRKSTVMKMVIPLLSSFPIGYSRAVAKVELGRRDHWKNIGTGEGRELTVLAANLQGVVRHHGVRGLFTRFPIFSASLASIVFFCINFIVLTAFILSAMRWRHYEDDEEPAQELEPVALPSAELPVKSARRSLSRDGLDMKPLRRRTSSRRSSRGASGSIKPEAVDTILPSADSAIRPLRRRVSRPFEPTSDPDT